MVFEAMSLGTSSGSIVSLSASNSGRRYGSILSVSDPGRYPSRSPASTAGRVRMIRSTSLRCSAWTAFAMARYVLPVPAGPMPNTMVFSSMACTYCFWPCVFGRTVRPRDCTMASLSTSDRVRASSSPSRRALVSISWGSTCCPSSTIATTSSMSRRRTPRPPGCRRA
ncbi:hypothetical protein BC477_15055 [Clavibacter michiganensis subsp. michiganensis]|uniref:Uncharacterized protein n=1 Tax=Clavibacter michiganensis subsp. michiganensis TaxID=33013 RepID=A0A251XCR7_CLAMM|nr:hypothetical protein BC477_15055 [Clavibacter michiganensis subsp. michiganensis]OUD99842.1 hypothetical protein CMMCAS07_20420 [Clavibacter michiganensis subsp. michiganensis]